MKKIKMVSIALSFTILSAGTTYALTDSGAKLSDWYKYHFEKSAQTLSAAMIDKLSTNIRIFHEDLSPMLSRVSNSLLDYQKQSNEDAKASIQEHKQHYLEQLDSTKKELEDQNKQQVDSYIKQKKQDEEQSIENDVKDILSDLVNS